VHEQGGDQPAPPSAQHGLGRETEPFLQGGGFGRLGLQRIENDDGGREQQRRPGRAQDRLGLGPNIRAPEPNGLRRGSIDVH